MADLVTDEEVEAVILATADLPQRGIIRAALEAFAPLLIERLAKEAEGKCSHVDCGPCRQGDKTAKFLRSHMEVPDDT